MKKHSLLVLFCFVGLSAFCQSNKINKQDSVPYHFSLKNGWALKVNALQPFVYGEFRLGIEKRITKMTSLELINSYYIASLQQFYAKGGRADSYAGQYFGKNNYKIGLGFILKEPETQHPIFVEFSFFYHYSEDFKINVEDDAQPYLFNQKSNFDFITQEKVFCFQILCSKRIKKNHLFLEPYFGFSLREKYLKLIARPYSKDYSPIVIYNDLLPYAYTGVFLVNKISLNVIPMIQLGVNIGIQSK
jgi:hypothetical protein